uniref:DUF547 domain-containing protein n=1 Tax=Ekhidna sp. TaxID=2608089 RepID=UPI0032EFFD3E
MSISAQQGVSHSSYDELLKKYVDDKGMVNYKGLKGERQKLKSYLKVLESNAPKDNWTSDQKLAYWINAYNAYTLELILEHYPVESIKDIGSTIKIPFVSTAWDIKFINIGGEEYDLNNIEHGIIRKEFNEPRIHFALVCAAVSCPKLQNRAYIPEKLDEQLTKAASDFLGNPAKNTIQSSNKATLSKLFNWYGGDFNNDGTLIEYINQYAPVKLNKDAEIDWMDYDWALNEQK